MSFLSFIITAAVLKEFYLSILQSLTNLLLLIQIPIPVAAIIINLLNYQHPSVLYTAKRGQLLMQKRIIFLTGLKSGPEPIQHLQ